MCGGDPSAAAVVGSDQRGPDGDQRRRGSALVRPVREEGDERAAYPRGGDPDGHVYATDGTGAEGEAEEAERRGGGVRTRRITFCLLELLLSRHDTGRPRVTYRRDTNRIARSFLAVFFSFFCQPVTTHRFTTHQRALFDYYHAEQPASPSPSQHRFTLMSMICITKKKKGNPEFYREYVSEDSLNQRPILLRRHRLTHGTRRCRRRLELLIAHGEEGSLEIPRTGGHLLGFISRNGGWISRRDGGERGAGEWGAGLSIYTC